jgi:glycosyltransferase involved in cell wall biosynthesis
VIVPSIGREAGLSLLLDSLDAQSFPRENFEILVALMPAALSPAIRARLDASEARPVLLAESRGPGAARNVAAQRSRGEILAFTEDDCVVDREWLQHAARRFDEESDLDALDGWTEKPGGRAVRLRPGKDPLYLPTNLFVKREAFERAGGYGECFFEPRGGIYFREDSDFGFALEESGARVLRDRTVIVLHPDEHARFWDPIRWARRYVMDPLLERRHPALFRERIEVVSVGPLRLRRPFVRACALYVAGLALMLAGALMHRSALTIAGALAAAAGLLVVWAKWRFDPRRLPVAPIVPFVLLYSLAQGVRRAAKIMGSSRPRVNPEG